jgi:hypothetical protein
MNAIETNDATRVRELSDAELASVDGGFLGAATLWMKIMDATPTQGADRATGTCLTPSQIAKVS